MTPAPAITPRVPEATVQADDPITPPAAPPDEPTSETMLDEVELSPAAKSASPLARRRRPRKGAARTIAPALPESMTELDLIEPIASPVAPALSPVFAAARTRADAAAATPVAQGTPTRAIAPPAEAPPEPEPAAPTGVVEAPGWPQPGELSDPATAKAAAAQSEAPAPDPDPVLAAGDGFRPYRAVYTPFTQRSEGPAGASDDRADRTLSAPGGPDLQPAPEQRETPRIRRGAQDTNGRPRSAREREIAEKVRRALGEDELPPHFDHLVASVLAQYVDGETNPSHADPIDAQDV